MTKLMTLLEDFLAYRGMRYLRLDGHVSEQATGTCPIPLQPLTTLVTPTDDGR